jgi:hypothetical protein
MQKKIRARFAVPALLAAAAIPSIVLAQAQLQTPGKDDATRSERQAQRPSLSAQSRARLEDGRYAMIKETLKLNDAQLKLWEPVEAQMRQAMAERQQRREERREARRRTQDQMAAGPALPDRLDRASARMAKRAADLKAFAQLFRPFYESLDEEQKSLAGIVLKQARAGHRGHYRRWAMQR